MILLLIVVTKSEEKLVIQGIVKKTCFRFNLAFFSQRNGLCLTLFNFYNSIYIELNIADYIGYSENLSW